MNGIPALAQHLQSQGRGNDSVLVHMTPGEVAGLQSLALAHGGSLTINPRTGLAEAGFLSSILPTIAGIGLAAATGGTSLALTPGMIGLGVGGITTLMTGSLTKGLMAGLGAYGGAGLAGGLMEAGTIGGAIPPGEVGQVGSLSTAGAAEANQLLSSGMVNPPVTPGLISGPGAYMDPITGMGNAAANAQAGLGGALDITGQAAAQQAAQPSVLQQMSDAFSNNTSKMGEGISKLFDFSDPNQGKTWSNLIGTAEEKDKQGNVIAEATGLGGGMGALKTAALSAAPMIAGSVAEPAQATDSEGKPVSYIRPYKFDAGRVEDIEYRTGKPGESTSEQIYFNPVYTPLPIFKAPGDITKEGEYAGGGITALKHGGMEEGGYVVAADVVSHLGNGSTKAGQKLLAHRLGGVPLNGAGDGMSDSIPTTIEGKQKARVADGEVYIPPGRAKPEALDKMMKRIRKAKTGKTRQAPELNTSKFVPA